MFKKVFRKTAAGFYLGNIKKFNKVHRFIKFALIREAIRRVNENLLNIDFDHVDSALKLLSSKKISGEVNLPNDLLIAKSYEDFIIAHKSRINPKYSYTIDSFGEYKFEHVSFRIKKVKVKKLDLGSNVALIDPKKFKFPIEITVTFLQSADLTISIELSNPLISRTLARWYTRLLLSLSLLMMLLYAFRELTINAFDTLISHLVHNLLDAAA